MKCAYCQKTIEPSQQSAKFRSKTYHTSCLEELKLSLKQTAIAKDNSLRKNLDETELEHYICKVFNIGVLPPKLHKQLEQMHMEWNCPWTDILKVARYWFEIVPKEEANPMVSLGILPYYKEEALAFWEEIEEANAYNKGKSLSQKKVVLPYHSKLKTDPSLIRMEEL